MGKATEVFVFCVAAVVVIAVSEIPTATDAFLEPFASQFIAKKMMLKHGFSGPAAAPAQVIYYQPQPRPSPPRPHISYQSYVPQTTSYPSYGPPASYVGYSEQAAVKPSPAYGPISYVGYSEQPAPAVKPAPQTSSYPSYGPPSSYVGYSEQPAPVVKPAPSYGPSVSYAGYGEQQPAPAEKPAPSYGPPQVSYVAYVEQPAPVVKPTQPPPTPSGCPPAPQVDYSNYAVHGGHGYGK